MPRRRQGGRAVSTYGKCAQWAVVRFRGVDTTTHQRSSSRKGGRGVCGARRRRSDGIERCGVAKMGVCAEPWPGRTSRLPKASCRRVMGVSSAGALQAGRRRGRGQARRDGRVSRSGGCGRAGRGCKHHLVDRGQSTGPTVYRRRVGVLWVTDYRAWWMQEAESGSRPWPWWWWSGEGSGACPGAPALESGHSCRRTAGAQTPSESESGEDDSGGILVDGQTARAWGVLRAVPLNC